MDRSINLKLTNIGQKICNQTRLKMSKNKGQLHWKQQRLPLSIHWPIFPFGQKKLTNKRKESPLQCDNRLLDVRLTFEDKNRFSLPILLLLKNWPVFLPFLFLGPILRALQEQQNDRREEREKDKKRIGGGRKMMGMWTMATKLLGTICNWLKWEENCCLRNLQLMGRGNPLFRNSKKS